jgi:probable phosphoglycerate mutase
MNSKTIYIVRRGQTDFNKLGIVQGSGVDSSLNATGWQQARAFYEKYKNENFDAVLTSTLVRTHETMSPFIESGLPWEQFAEINEISWGAHEGKKSNPQMKAEFLALLDAWHGGQYDASIAGGESAQDMWNRLNEFVIHLKQRPEERLLVCSHGRAMRCLMTVLGNDPLHKMKEYHHANTGLYLVDYTADLFKFQLQNDLSHLEDLSLVDEMG